MSPSPERSGFLLESPDGVSLPTRRRAGRPLAWGLGLALLASAALSGGCITMASPEISSMKTSIESELAGADFDRQFGIRLGRISLGLGRTVLRAVLRHEDGVADSGEASGEPFSEERVLDLLRGLHKVEVGVYEAEHMPAELAPTLPARIEETMARREWLMAARIRDQDEMAWVFYQVTRGEMRGVYVVVLDDEELTLVRLRGRLDRALAAGISLAYRAADDRGRARGRAEPAEPTIELAGDSAGARTVL